MKKSVRRSAEHRMLSVPGLGLFKGSIGNSTDFAVGAAAGLLGQGAVKYLLGTTGLMDKLPTVALRVLPTLSGLATGYTLFALQKRRNYAKAKAHLVGATTAGVIINVWDELKAAFPATFNDYVTVGYNGVLVGTPYQGVLVDTARSQQNLGALRSMELVNEDADAI